MSAGNDAVQMHTDHGTINYGTVLTLSEVLEIGKGAARTVLMESWPFAEKLIDQRIQIILESLIKKMQEKDEALLNKFRDPRFLAALVSIEKSFAETGDIELGEILTGLLTDLASKELRSRREIVLREAIECAPRLTTKHLNALSVILRIDRIRYPFDRTVAVFISSLAGDLSPYFNAIPDDNFDYEYMGATEAGTYLRMVESNIFERVYYSHRNALYEPFAIDDFVNYLKEKVPSIEEFTACLNDVSGLLKVVPDDPQNRIKLDWEDGERVLRYADQGTHTVTLGEQYLHEFLMSRSMSLSQFEDAIRNQQPELGKFLDTLQSSRAFDFRLSPVGIMLARHEIGSRSPESAAQIDALFDD